MRWQGMEKIGNNWKIRRKNKETYKQGGFFNLLGQRGEVLDSLTSWLHKDADREVIGCVWYQNGWRTMIANDNRCTACVQHPVDADTRQGEHSPPDVHVKSWTWQILNSCSCLQLAMTIQLEVQEWRKYGNKTGWRRSRGHVHGVIADKKMRMDVVMGVGFHRNGECWWRHFDCNNTLRFLSDVAHQNGGLGLFCLAQFAAFLIRSGRHFFVFLCPHVTSLTCHDFS